MVVRLRHNTRVVLISVVSACSVLGTVALASAGEAAAASGSCRPTPKAKTVKLVLTPGAVAAGKAIHYRIDNSAGPTITYGPGYSIQECVASVWVLAPFSPPGAARVKIAQRPSRGRWEAVPIPATAIVGQYRVRKSVSTEEGGRSLYGEFDIVSTVK
jgi:hypothetical protein